MICIEATHNWHYMSVCPPISQQKMQVDSQAINFGIKPEFLTQPAGPDLIQAIHRQRDLIQSSTPFSNQGEDRDQRLNLLKKITYLTRVL